MRMKQGHGSLFRYGAAYEWTHRLFRKRSKHQLVEVYETDFFGRVLVLDGDIQLTERNEHVYHEVIAHVPLNLVPRAQSVLIVGGGDGGTAREVLKHGNVERVTMVELDPVVLYACKRYLPSVHQGSFDDPRMDLIIADARKWARKGTAREEEPQHDIVIVDLTDQPADGNLKLFAALKARMTSKSMLVVNSECLIYGTKVVLAMASVLRKVFAHVRIFKAAVPEFASGTYAFLACSDVIDATNTLLDLGAIRAKGIPTRYYSPAIHRESFVLPADIVKLQKSEKSEKSSQVRTGYHVVLDMTGVPQVLLDNAQWIMARLRTAADLASLKVLKVAEHRFQPHGFTGMLLLSSSHISVHTFPETRTCSVDVYSCSEDTDFDKLHRFLLGAFEPERVRVQYMERCV
jgi:spermidine synthase